MVLILVLTSLDKYKIAHFIVQTISIVYFISTEIGSGKFKNVGVNYDKKSVNFEFFNPLNFLLMSVDSNQEWLHGGPKDHALPGPYLKPNVWSRP